MCSSDLKKGPVPRRIGRTKGGLNSKLHAVCDGQGLPLILLLSEGLMSDYKGAALMIDASREPTSCWATGAMMRLVPPGPDRARHYAVHPVKDQS